MLNDMACIKENNTWSLTDLPAGYYLIGLNWVFKVKKGVDGIMMKHSHDSSQKGYAQCEDANFDGIFAPMSKLDSVRLLVTIATKIEWNTSTSNSLSSMESS